MGYCERHDTVYAGGECPVCAETGAADDGTGPDRPAEEPVVRDRPDGPPSTEDEQPSRSPESDVSSRSTDDDEGSPETGTGDRIADEVADALGGDVSVEADDGDVVVGDQSKSVDRSERVEVDESETVIDNSEIHRDERTVVNDSVVNRSNVGGDDEATVDDSVVNRSNVGGEAGRTGGPEPDQQAQQDRTGAGSSPGGSDESRTCPDCRAEVDSDDAFCTSCGSRLPDRA